MIAVQQPLQDLPAQRMRQLRSAGFSLLPLGGGKDGKSPLCGFSERDVPLEQCLGIMRAKGSSAYGIRLQDTVVVDADEFGPDLEEYVESRFGPARVQVATPRGRHFFYRHSVGAFPNLRAEGLPFDVKSGANAYVAGPGSIRPDGGEYIEVSGVLGDTALTDFRDSQAVVRAYAAPFTLEGSRNQFLCKKAREYAPFVNSQDELCSNLLHDRDTLCEKGDHPMSDAEVVKIASWGWGLRSKPGALFKGRQSRFDMERNVMDVLLGIPGGGAEAFALYGVLKGDHGHIPGKRFGLDFDGMKKSGRIAFGRDRFRSALQILVANGLLRKSGGYIPGRQSQQYQLGRLDAEPREAQSLEAVL